MNKLVYFFELASDNLRSWCQPCDTVDGEGLARQVAVAGLGRLQKLVERRSIIKINRD